MRICNDCDNLLYPVQEQRRLVYKCRKCGHKEDVHEETNEDQRRMDYCVSRTKYITTAEEQQKGLQDIAADPTLPRAAQHCERCGNDEAIYFQASENPAANMKLFFVCSNKDCGHRWLT